MITPSSVRRFPASLAHHCRALALLLAATACALAAGEVRVSPPADPAADAVPAIRAALERVRAEGASRLVLEPGTYQLYPRRAEEFFLHVSNHDPGLRTAAFPLVGLRDLEVVGTGARLVMHGQAFIAFLVRGSERIALRGFTIDWDRPLCLQAKVVAVDAADDSFDVETLPECGAQIVAGQLVFGDGEGWIPGRNFLRAPWQTPSGQVWWQDTQWTHWVDPETARALPREAQLPLRPYNQKLGKAAVFEELGKNRFRLRHAAPSLPRLGTAFVSKGEIMPNRSTPALHVSRSRDIRIEDVTIHHAGGMGLIAEETENVALRRYRLVRPPGSARLVSTTADATHFNQCRGRIVVEDSEFAHMLDDAINVHGVYARVDAALGPRTAGLLLYHFQQLGMEFARPGDRLRFSASDTLLGYGERTVASVRPVNQSFLEVTFTEPIEGFLRPDSCVDNLACQPDLEFRRNHVHDNRARAVLVTSAGRVLIEDNRFEHSSMMSILIEGDCQFWHESGPVRDVCIRRNTFATQEPDVPCIRISPQQPREKALQPPYHANIRIEGNTFVLPGAAVLSANRVRGLRFLDNEVRPAQGNAEAGASPRSAATAGKAVADPASSQAKRKKGGKTLGGSDSEAISLRACEDVVIERNRFRLPGPAAIVQQGPTPGLSVRDNEGLAPILP